jgi:hypothetical protein
MTRNTGVVGIFSDSGEFYPVPDLPYVYMHKDGCGGPAFMSSWQPQPGGFYEVKNGFLYLDGTPAKGTPKGCGTCGMPLYQCNAEYFKKTVGG